MSSLPDASKPDRRPEPDCRDEHRPLAGASAADSGGLAGALEPGSPPVGDCSAGLAPILLTGAYLIAGILQPASYSPVHSPPTARSPG